MKGSIPTLATKMKTYNAEKPAFENQKKASEDYQKWNDDPKVEQKK